MNKNIAPVLLGLVATIPMTRAETNPDPAVIVTATRTAQTVDDAMASVTVITREQIERGQAASVAELLTAVAGMDFSISGGYGKNTSLYLRGTNSTHTLVLIDGVKMGSATAGSVAWEQLPLSQIERIEIVRGPRSSLYGSEAIGGVIQIFTRRGQGPLTGRVTGGYGTYDTKEYAASVSGESGNSHYSLSAARFATSGFNAQTPTSGPTESDNDGYRNTSGSIRVGHRYGPGERIDAYFMRTQGDVEFDGAFQNESDVSQQAVGVSGQMTPAANWLVKLVAGQSRDSSDNFKNGVFVSTFDTVRNTGSWQNDLTIGSDQLLTVGVDTQQDRIISSTQFAVRARRNDAVFAQHQIKTATHDVQLSLRHDDNEQFGGHGTGAIGWGLPLRDGLRFTASYGTGFRAPSFNELYFPGYGNPNLRPEQSESYELALRGKHAAASWRLSAYRTRIEDLITDVCIANCGTTSASFQPQNVKRARISGLEAEASTVLAQWKTRLHVTWLNPRDSDSDRILPRRSRRSARLEFDRAFNALHLGATLIAQDERFDDTLNTIRVGGYGLLNLRMQYDLTKQWFIRGRVDNALDKAYQTVHTYNTAGRHYFLQIGYQTSPP